MNVYLMSLKVEDSDEYKKVDHRIQLLELLKEYYGTGGSFYDFDTGDIPLRELIAFMSDEGYPRRLPDAEVVLKRIDTEILELQNKKKNMRLQEMESRNLNSLLIITSWTKLIETPIIKPTSSIKNKLRANRIKPIIEPIIHPIPIEKTRLIDLSFIINTSLNFFNFL